MHPSPEHEQRLRHLMQVFLTENAKINLSALRTEDACWTGNILDSLALQELECATVLEQPNSKLIDVGTGGGFPLLPLAIVYPQARCTGLDSIRKKIDAVTRIAKEADITVATVANRAEVLGHDKKFREQFDIVTSRAVAPLGILLEYVAAFAKVGGHIVLWKSMHIDGELAESGTAQRKLNCELVHTHQYELGGDWGTRQLLVFKKTAALDKQYPREVGMAKKETL